MTTLTCPSPIIEPVGHAELTAAVSGWIGITRRAIGRSRAESAVPVIESRSDRRRTPEHCVSPFPPKALMSGIIPR